MFYVGLYVRIDPPLPGSEVPAAGYVALVSNAFTSQHLIG